LHTSSELTMKVNEIIVILSRYRNTC